MVLDKLPVPGRPTIWMIVGQGPTALEILATRASKPKTSNQWYTVYGMKNSTDGETPP